MYKAVIVDDEQLVVQDLKGLLTLHCPQVDISDTATSSQEAFDKIKSIQPDLVFMDINIDEMSGLQLVRKLEDLKTRVIFVTAHDQYAIEAFKLSAIDYLLKPVDSEELIEAVRKATSSIDADQMRTQIQTMVHNLASKPASKKIVLSDLEGMHIIDIPEILWCHANGSYTDFVIQGGEKITVSKHLKTYEEVLTEHGLMRVHRSYIVNINNITKIDRSKGEILMKHGEILPISIAPDTLKALLSVL